MSGGVVPRPKEHLFGCLVVDLLAGQELLGEGVR